MRPDGIQLWEHKHRQGEEVHAAKNAVTLCGRWMPSRGRPSWLTVADNIKITCAGCAAALREVDRAGNR